MEITVIINDVQKRALEHTMYDIQDWLQNAIDVRSESAIEELLKVETERLINDPYIQSIPANKNEIILNSPIETAKARTIRVEKEYAAGCNVCDNTPVQNISPEIDAIFNEALGRTV